MTSVIHFMWFWSLLNELHNKNILSVFTIMKPINQSNQSICQSVHQSIRQSVIQSVNQSRPLISSSSVLSSSHLNTPRVSLHHSGSTRSFLVSVIHLEAYLAVTSFHSPSVTLMYKITKHNNHQSTHENGLTDAVLHHQLSVSLSLHQMPKAFNSCYYKGIEYRNNI